MHKIWLCKHSTRNKKGQSERNANCKAFVDILIKKNNQHTQRNDKYLQMSPPLMTTIKIHPVHSHSTSAADYLRLRRINEETKKTFHGYFNEGLSVCEAKSLHESKLLLEDNPYVLLADAAVNPTRRQLHYLHNIWREKNFGPIVDPYCKLSEKISLYRKEGIKKFLKHINQNMDVRPVHISGLKKEASFVLNNNTKHVDK